MHLSSLLPPQLVLAPAPIGYVVYDPKAQQFQKTFPWGLAQVSLTGAGVTPIFSFVEHNIAVSTPYGKGTLIGHSRPDGIIQVKTEGAVVYTTFDQVAFIEDEAASAIAAAAEPAAEPAAELEQEAADFARASLLRFLFIPLVIFSSIYKCIFYA